jgi:serine protease Do
MARLGSGHLENLNEGAEAQTRRSPRWKGFNMSTESRLQLSGRSVSRGMIVALLLGTAAGAGGTWALASTTTTSPITVTPSNPQPGFAQLVSRVKPAVVEIATVSGGDESQGAQTPHQMPDLPAPFRDMLPHGFDGQQQGLAERRALGSGFIVDSTGYIVTNNHVVDGARMVSVTLTDGAKYKAKVVGRDSKTDLALLKIDAGHPLPYVAFGDSDKEHEGDWVVAVGNPYGLGGTVTAGIVSAHGRNINEGPYDDFLQIDAPINPGNSGGPLFDQSGQVVGIDTAIYSPSGGSVGIGFAIPSNVAKNIVNQLREHGKVARGWIGVQMQPLTPALAKAVGLPNDEGVLVDTITDGSPAAHAKIEQGDVITAYDGKAMRNARDLAMAVANTTSGKTVTMKVWRDNRARSLDVTVGSPEHTRVAVAENNAGMKPVGMALESLTPDTRSQLGIGSDVSGVLVGQVTPGSNADECGIQSGDIIQRVGGQRVQSPNQVADAIHAAEQAKKQAISLLVMRDGLTSYLGLQLQA